MLDKTPEAALCALCALHSYFIILELIEMDAGDVAFSAMIDKNVLEDTPKEELRAYRELLEGNCLRRSNSKYHLCHEQARVGKQNTSRRRSGSVLSVSSNCCLS